MQNRVLNVRKLVGPERWFYVPTSVSPADVATRVMSPKKFPESELWWKGPKFLTCEKKSDQFKKLKLRTKSP